MPHLRSCKFSKILVLFISYVQDLGDSVGVFIYAPVDGSHFDYSLLVIWSFAVLTVAIGAYWSGLVRHEL